MNLQELNGALPKDWLTVKAHEIDCDILNASTFVASDIKTTDLWVVGNLTTGPLGCGANFAYDPLLAAGTNLSAISNASHANVFRLGQQVSVSGSFQATLAAGIAVASFTIDLPILASSTLGDRRSARASCNNTTASFISMSLIDVVNVSPTQLRFDLRTATGANEPGAPTANVVFHYEIIFESST